jgi:hypothetical protein
VRIALTAGESVEASLSDAAADVPTSASADAIAGGVLVSSAGVPTTYLESESATARKAGATTTVGG